MEKICLVGLGYVGLPLAVEFGKSQEVIGYDVSEKRVSELKNGVDSSEEVNADELKNTKIIYTFDPSNISEATFIIVAVPTPISESKVPDLTYLESASEIVGKNLSKGAVVVYESTVYPGATEEICAPLLEKHSGQKLGVDFKIGYSPERINPGDKEHTVDKIVKVVSGMDEESAKRIAEVYKSVITAGVHIAKDIKTAESAKVIENIQRDLNIALMNELSLIFDKMGIATKDVLEAAGTKWNFHKYHPGLVGGHCIGVDPYYLTYKAQQMGYEPQIILAGRNINEHMSKQVADLVIRSLNKNNAKVAVFGLTFKENVRDYRNTKAKDVIRELKDHGYEVIGCDPLIEDDIVKSEFGVDNYKMDDIEKIDCAVMISPHDEFKELTLEKLKSIMDQPILVDVPSYYNSKEAKDLGFLYRAL